MNTTNKTRANKSSKQPFEVFTADGFYSCGTLSQCKRVANQLAAGGEQAYVYAAGDSSTVVYDPCAE